MSRIAPKRIEYDTLHTFDDVAGLELALIKAAGEEDGFLQGAPLLHLVFNLPTGPERVFSINPSHEALAIAVGQGITRALAVAHDEWTSPTPAEPIPGLDLGEGVVIPFPRRRG